MDTQQILISYITAERIKGRGQELSVNDDLLSTGILDSLAILQLVTFIEEKFNVRINDEDVTYENFHSVAALSHYLGQLQQKAKG